MKQVVCKKCGASVAFNSYFGAYICTVCNNWRDDSYHQKRIAAAHYPDIVEKKNDD